MIKKPYVVPQSSAFVAEAPQAFLQASLKTNPSVNKWIEDPSGAPAGSGVKVNFWSEDPN